MPINKKSSVRAEGYRGLLERTWGLNSGRIRKLLLLDSDATTQLASERMREFVAQADYGDTVVFYFAGHGFTESGEYRFAMFDCDFNSTASTGTLSLTELQSVLESTRAKRVIILDSCHSGEELPPAELTNQSETDARLTARSSLAIPQQGSSTQSRQLRRMIVDDFESSVSASGTTVIAASDGGQFALESEQWQNGAFTFCGGMGCDRNSLT